MNIHYLRKIRKRYEWYFNSQGFPVLLDKLNKIVQVYNVEYVKLCTGVNDWQELIDNGSVTPGTSNQEVAFTVMKVHLYRYIGESRDARKTRRNYLMATKRFEKLKGKKSYENNNSNT